MPRHTNVPVASRHRSLAAAIVRHRLGIAVIWAVAVAGLAPRAREISRVLDVAGYRTGHTEAGEVERRLAADFASPYARYAILVVTGIPAVESEAGQAVVRTVTAAVARAPGVARTLSYLSTHDTAFVGPRSTFMVVGLTAPRVAADDWIAGLRAATNTVERTLRERYPEARLAWTGNAALNYDFRAATSSDAARAERRIVPLTLVLLLVVFGSVVAAMVPLLAAGVAIVASCGLAVLLAHAGWPLSVVLRNSVSMLGLGAGIDYALLVVSRFREALSRGEPPPVAAASALRTAGHTVLLSAAAVVVSFAALLTVSANELRSIATGGLLVVAVSALLATTLLPGILSWLGPRVDALALPGPGWWGVRRPERRSRTAWLRWGRWTATHPWRVLLMGSVPLLLLGLQARRLNANLPSGDWLPQHAESAVALRALHAMGKSNLIETLRVLVVLPKGSGALTPDGWGATRRLTEALAADPRVGTVRSLPSVTHALRPSATVLSVMPADALRTFVSRDGQETELEVVPDERTSISAAVGLARAIRGGDAVGLTGLPGTRILVGGLPAFDAEYQDQVRSRIGAVVLLVVGGSFIALLIGFRSILVPVKAVLLNLLSVAAAFGAAVLVFQDGYGVRLLGLSAPVDGLFPAVPLVVFCLVFGFSMDYEVFLVARVAEAARAGADPETAVADGVARTGGVITSAAAIMVVVFAAFALSDFLLIKIIGFTLAAAIFLDATLVRMAVGPALLRLAGHWNWWPGLRSTRADSAARALDGPTGGGAAGAGNGVGRGADRPIAPAHLPSAD